MCLYVDTYQTDLYLREYNTLKSDVLTFYKEFIKGGACLITPYQRQNINGPGTQRIEHPIFLTSVLKEINEGAFHLKHEHTKETGCFSDIEIPVIVLAKNVIAFGRSNDVAVSEYEITKEIWSSTFKKGFK